MRTPAQITICGALGKDAIAQLVEIAMSAGAALVVQPRAIAATSAVVDAPRALPPASKARPEQGRRKTVAPVPEPSRDRRDDRQPSDGAVRAFLSKNGPARPRDFQEEFDLDVRTARQAMADLAARGVVELVGVTNGRRVRLPGQRAKEAP